MLEKYDDVIDINNLCEILHIGKNTAYRLLQDKEIPNRQMKRKCIIPKQGVIDYLNAITKNND